MPCGSKLGIAHEISYLRLLGPRMRFVVDAGQVREIKVRVDLRRTDVGMPQEFLDAAQVAARLEQVRREGMAQQVRMHRHVEAARRRPAADAPLDRARAEAAAALPDEERAGPVLHERPAFAEPGAEREHRLAADGQHAGLRALAEHAHRAVGEVEVGRRRGRRAPRGAGPTSRGAPASRGRGATGRRSACARAGFATWSTSSVFGSRFAAFGARISAAGFGLEDLLADQVVEEAAQRRQPALDAARTEAVAVLAGGEGAHVMKLSMCFQSAIFSPSQYVASASRSRR